MRGRSHNVTPIRETSAAYSVLEQIERAEGTLTVSQLAKIYGVSRQTIYNAIDDGKIPVMDIGLNVVRIDPKSLAVQLRRNNPAMKLAASA